MKLDDSNMDFLQWMTVHTYAFHKYDLATSGMKNVYLRDVGLDSSEIEVSAETPLYKPPSIIEAIAKKEGVSKDMVQPVCGCSTSNLVICAHFLSPGDEVIVENPGYGPLIQAAGFSGAKTIFIERRFEEKFQIDLDRLKKLITPKTKLMVMTNLHNPSGTLTPPATIKAIGELAEKHGFYVLCDEVFLDFMDTKKPPTAAAQHPRFITTSSLTKVYGLGYLRCGWIIAQPQIISDLSNMLFMFGPVVTPPVADLSVRMLSKSEALKDRFRKILGTNFPIAKKWIETSGVMEWVEPSAGLISFPRCALNINSRDVAELLIEKYDTFFVPGSFFGFPRHFRMGLNNPDPEMFEQGLKNVTAAIKEIASRKVV